MHSDEAVIPMVALAIPDSCPVAVPLPHWPTGAWGVVTPSPLDGSPGSHVMERGTSSTVKQSECPGTGQVGGARWEGLGAIMAHCDMVPVDMLHALVFTDVLESVVQTCNR